MESSKIINSKNLEKKIFIHQFTQTKDIDHLDDQNKDHLINNINKNENILIENLKKSITIEKETTNKS